MRHGRIFLVVCFFFPGLPHCVGDDYPIQRWKAWQEDAGDRYPRRTWMMYETPEEAGWSAGKLGKAGEYFETLDAAAAFVVQGGAVLAAWGEIDRRFPCHSVRKSLLNAVYGVHVAEGNIDLKKTLAELGIDDDPPLSAAEKRARVIDLLRARSGVYHPAAYETQKMKETRPARDTHERGEVFWYNNWDFNTLCTIFELQTGTKFFEEFQKRLAVPLEMEDFRLQDTYYHLEAEHSIHPAYPFRMSARDMARVGHLFVRGGKWRDVRILPEEWVRKSAESHFSKDDETANSNYGYGYLWWPVVDGRFKDLEMFSARGYGGHAIDVVAAADLVLVMRVDTFWDLNLPLGREKHRVETSERFELLGLILDARVEAPRANPKLVSMPDAKKPAETITLAPEVLAKYAGEYQFEGFKLNVKATAGGLLVGTAGIGEFSLPAISKTEFLWEDLNMPVTFELDSAGRPVKMIAASSTDKQFDGLPVRKSR